MTVQQTSTPEPQVQLRRAFATFPTGVVAVCALDDEGPMGMAVNSFTSISLDPPLAAISVARTSTTWPALSTRARLGLSILSSAHGAVCRRLSSRDGDRFAGVDWHADQQRAVYVRDSALWLQCSVADRFDGGDHEIVLLEIHDVTTFPDVAPLVFHESRFRDLVDG
ncbi:flavin reductase family protein [Agromyces kandeliae]|uniref:Flavin reductase like domain-containing protein n=1 Tax=Agromyces kandeliae TaxID=2666141 RepID=A0A6L5R2S7_9MICO|nr:flavin reductase family protein [Agromyces kandeliae]MRX43327.1 hypothetical protein [Agromyces kandeliae]